MERRPRGPGVAYSVFAVLLVLLLATVALTTRQPPPPSIAEFAPQAVENITESPEDQGFARGAGAGVPTPTPTAEPVDHVSGPVDVPRVRKCVGDPPRQVEDPQSPPCVPYWSGDNGGATTKGVTRDEIRIADADYDWSAMYAPFFNKRFEFYGRQLKVVDTSGASQGGDATGQRADAVAADESFNVFATAIYRRGDGDTGFYYYDELARRGVVSSMARTQHTESQMKRRHPYLWSYSMAPDREFPFVGSWVCSRLAGRQARHAGSNDLRGLERKFGVVLQVFNTDFEADFRSAATGLDKELAACGQQPEHVFIGGSAGESQDRYTNAVLQLKTSGVTSVVCLCGYFNSGLLATHSTSQSFFPEWLLTSYFLGDQNATLATWQDRTQLSHAMGITVHPRQWTSDREPASWALREIGRPSVGEDQGLTREAFNRGYRSMLLLASGIQMAGPHLTAESFARALNRTRFPNPAHPNRAGAVGFTDGDHSMTDDVAEWWWSQQAKGPYADDGGTICYVDGGARRDKAKFPSGDDVFFRPPCDSGA